MEVLPCPVNVDFSNTRGKRSTALSVTAGPPFNPSVLARQLSASVEPPSSEPLFSADNAGWNQLIFAFATRRFVGRIAPEIRFELVRYERRADFATHRRFTGETSNYSCVSVGLPIVRGAGREGGMPFAAVFPCSSIVLVRVHS